VIQIDKTTTNIEVPSYDQLIWPTVKALKALGGSGSNKEIYDKLVELEGYSEDIQQVSASDNTNVSSLLEYRSFWARTYLKKYGAIESSGRGVWVLLDKGEKLTEAEVAKIPSVVRKQDRLQKQKKEAEIDFIKDDEDEVGEEDWKESLLNVLKVMDPSAFERLIEVFLLGDNLHGTTPYFEVSRYGSKLNRKYLVPYLEKVWK
jgi:restriction system protein